MVRPQQDMSNKKEEGMTIFISHRLADSIEAERLAHALRNAGRQVWLDIWEIRLGDSIIERMNKGLEESCYLLLCYSSEGTLASWINREWMSALAQQLNGHNIRLIPVKLTGGEPPSILSDIKYADLTKDWKSGVLEILRATK